MSDFDVIVIGGGPGGYKSAINAAHLGARVALIEKGMPAHLSQPGLHTEEGSAATCDACWKT